MECSMLSYYRTRMESYQLQLLPQIPWKPTSYGKIDEPVSVQTVMLRDCLFVNFTLWIEFKNLYHFGHILCLDLVSQRYSSHSCFRFFSLSPVAPKVYTLYYTKFQRYLKQSWLQESRKGTQTSKEWRMDALIWRQQCRVDIFN